MPTSDRYLVTRERECGECKGSGKLPSPWPDVGSFCAACKHTGRIREEIELAEALRAVGEKP